jgi:hypothetical protein
MHPDRTADETVDQTTVPFGAPMAAAALVVAGAAVAVVPQHAGSVIRLLLGALAVAALSLPLYLVARSAMDTPSSVLERVAWRRQQEDGVPGLGSLRSSLRTNGIVTGAPLPPTVRRQLAAIVATAVERHGLDPRDPQQRSRLSPATWAVLDADRARRPEHERRQEYRIKPAATAQLVHAVLDDLQRLDEGLAPRPAQKDRGAR